MCAHKDHVHSKFKYLCRGMLVEGSYCRQQLVRFKSIKCPNDECQAKVVDHVNGPLTPRKTMTLVTKTRPLGPNFKPGGRYGRRT